MFCAGLVYALGRPTEPRRLIRGIVIMLAAMLAHGVWDAESALAGGSAAVVLFILGTMVLSLLLLWVVYRVTVPREREWMREIMAPEVTRDVITKDELDALSGTRKQRKAYIKRGEGRRGRTTAKHVLQAAQDLAGDIAHAQGEDTDEVNFARTEVARIRAEAPVPEG